MEVYIDSGAENQQWVLEKYTLALDQTQLELASGQISYIYPTTSLLELTWASTGKMVTI